MQIYAISDLHLALSISKPMDIFGHRWSNYMDRLKTSWEMTVSNDDYVIVPGDISWATYLKQAFKDFEFLNSLPGKKIILKGNHDYWWTTISKLEQFAASNNFSTISFMHNNSFRLDKTILCGTRGWAIPDETSDAEDIKIFNRELNRLDMSLKSAEKTNNDRVIVALHYPPFNSKGEPSEFISIMKDYNVKMCIYGHLHGEKTHSAVEGEIEGICFKLVSADYLEFKPVLL